MFPSNTYFSFVESKTFERLAERYLPDKELTRLQAFLNENPLAGNLIPETGGVRKLRWGMPGRGKQGGMRVIYYVQFAEGRIWLLTLYPKNVVENIAARTLRKMKEEIDD
jgi:mRNA-degrading endonuclease RelE of RelBE toxin-antitoxin system